MSVLSLMQAGQLILKTNFSAIMRKRIVLLFAFSRFYCKTTCMGPLLCKKLVAMPAQPFR